MSGLVQSRLRTNAPSLLQCLSFAILAGFLYFVLKLYAARRSFRCLHRQGLPMPPHHPLWGHLSLVMGITKKLPKDAHGHYLADQIRLRYPHLDSGFYLDMWPFAEPFLVLISPEMAAQVSQPDRSLQRHPGIRKFMLPITGGMDFGSMKGESWKMWRKLFNPGFASGHVTANLVPEMVDIVLVFRDILRVNAQKGTIFSLETAALNVSYDVIGKVVLDADFNMQRGSNEMIVALQNQLQWCAFGSEPGALSILLNPLRPFSIWYNARKMDRYMNRQLDQRYSTNARHRKSKTIIDLALNDYLDAKFANEHGKMDKTFRLSAISQMKLFLFAGHDTNSTTICYIFLMLSRNPTALKKLRAEHESVFGNQASELLKSNPALLNQLPFTLAVIKETLRLFPVVSSPKIGQAGHTITSPSSNDMKFPTEGCMVWTNHHGTHHNPTLWPQTEEFIPERFLVASDHPLYPPRNAWRAFEYGPRACIATDLALAELKLVLVLTAREFDIEDAYAEWDMLHPTGKSAVKSVNGERAYQIQAGSAHPSDGFPARVKIC